MEEWAEEEEEVECIDDAEFCAGLMRVPPWTSEYSVAFMSGCFIIYDGCALTHFGKRVF